MRSYSKIGICIVVALVTVLGSCSIIKNMRTRKVKIETQYGDIKIVLYNETPLHRDNFIKLTKDDFYKDLIFHRVIDGFMIQSGDPDSRGAEKGARLGNGGPGYRIPAEIIPTKHHTKGALAAARSGDDTNPKRESSGSQFYIVEGKVRNDSELDKVEKRRKGMELNRLLINIKESKKDSIDAFKKSGNFDGYNKILEAAKKEAKAQLDSTSYIITEEVRELYKSVGGAPHLDGAYTIFGEVVEGMDIIDSISMAKTDRYDRPIDDIIINIVVD